MVTLLFTGAFLIIASLARSVTGGITDKLGGGNCCLIANFFIGIGSIILAFCPPNSQFHVLNLGGCFVMACGMGFLNSAVYKWIP